MSVVAENFSNCMILQIYKIRQYECNDQNMYCHWQKDVTRSFRCILGQEVGEILITRSVETIQVKLNKIW